MGKGLRLGLAAALFWAVARFAFAAETAEPAFQPALGRTLLQLADLYAARQVDTAGVEKLLGDYDRMLDSAGPDAILAVSEPRPEPVATDEKPDGDLVRRLYERAAAYGEHGALVGLGNLYRRGQIVERDEAKAFSAYQAAARNGDPEGQLRAAEMTIRGEGTERNLAAGLSALRALVATSDLRTLDALAELCLSGRVPVQADIALAALEKAARSGSRDAELQLGDFYSSGLAVAADYAKAIGHYRRAVKQGSAVARVQLAEMQVRGRGMVRDAESALKALRELSAEGEATASLLLGDYYRDGRVVASDPALSLKYYQDAARQGSTTALVRLGEAHASEPTLAAGFYRRAADQDNVAAKVRLAEMKAAGQGMARDGPAAFAELEALAADGESGASLALGDIYAAGEGTPVEPVRALDRYRQAAEEGSTTALTRLGDFYSDGRLVPADYGRAIGYYRDGARTGNASAKIRLAEMTARGQGTARDAGAAKATLNVLAGIEKNASAATALAGLYAEGALGGANPEMAFAYYDRAASLGDIAGKVRRAELRMLGQGVSRDVDAGRSELETLSAAGSGDAALALADFYAKGDAGGADPERARTYYWQAAATGSMTALVRLGDLYSDGRLVPTDYAHAVEYYRAAADKGSPAAKIRLAEMTVRGRGTARDADAGKAALDELAGAGGDAHAAMMLGDLYIEGAFGSPDPEMAFAAYGRAAALGDGAAKVRRAEMKALGQGVSQDANAARVELEALAAQGRTDAALTLADVYAKGEGLGIDPELARRYYRQAATGGSTTALSRLGDFYSDGRLVPVDYPKAAGYYREAAQDGNATAKIRLAEMTARGQGIVRDEDAAKAALMALAGSGGDARAAMSLGDLYTQGALGPGNETQAFAAYARAATLGNAAAKVRQAEMKVAGQGVAQDVKAGLGELSALAGQGAADASLALGDIYAKGEGVPVDIASARSHYQQAAADGSTTALLRLGDSYRPQKPEEAFASYRAAAEAGNLQARLRVAEMTIRGEGTQRDPQGGLAALRTLAKADNPAVLEELAGVGLSGRIPLQTALALSALDRASALGSVDAHVQLGNLYADGMAVKADPALALTHYREAAGRGSEEAQIRLAQMMAAGQGTPRNLIKAQAALKALGSADALLALGDMFGRIEAAPLDPALALKYYRAAAADGSVSARLRLAQGYADGRFGRRNFKEAEAHYRAAVETGNRGAMLALGRFQASRPSTRTASAGFARLRDAMEARVAGAPSVLAEALFYGRGRQQSSKSAMSVLRQAMADRDAAATLDLIAAYRDGKRDGRTLLVRKDIAKAKAILLASQDMLSEPEKDIEGFLIDAATARHSAFAKLNARFNALTQPEKRQIVSALPKTNGNLFIYIVKARLREKGIRVRQFDGRLDRQTQAALMRECRAFLPARQCRRGPFFPSVVEAVAQMF